MSLERLHRCPSNTTGLISVSRPYHPNDCILERRSSNVSATVMESLLRWGIENSTTPDGQQQPPVQPRTDLDPGIIEHILGKPDAVLMKEALEVAVDERRDEDERLQALDDFEMVRQVIQYNGFVAHASCSSWNILTMPMVSDHDLIGSSVRLIVFGRADLVKLKMWEPLQNLLTSPSSSDEIQTQVLWIIGTAVQNNPSAQTAVRSVVSCVV